MGTGGKSNAIILMVGLYCSIFTKDGLELLLQRDMWAPGPWSLTKFFYLSRYLCYLQKVLILTVIIYVV